MSTKNKILKSLIITVTAICAIAVVFSSYCILAARYLDESSVASFIEAYEVEKRVVRRGIVSYGDESAEKMLVFYPGGSVDHLAYEPLMLAVAAEGIHCVLLDVPLDMAFMAPDKAARVIKLYPEATEIYVAGHSLGGVVASRFASDNSSVDGLILLASYSIHDVTSVPTLSMYGSEDSILNYENYAKNAINLSAEYTEVVIDGGNHAYFGMYGEQKGDGVATVTNEQQIIAAAKEIADFIKK